MSAVTDTDVLIVGAGPVGLFLANECARRGLRWRLIEKRASQSEHSKALAIFPRTLEILDMAGIADRFLELANRVTSVAVETQGHRLATMRFAPPETPYPFVAMVPQDVTEQLLCEALRARGGQVEYRTSFVSAEQQGECVLVRMDRAGSPETVRASYVVGCDGAHSSVRHAVDVGFEGGEYADLFLLADITTNDVLPANEMQLCPSEAGPVAIFPMSATRRRIVGTVDEAIGEVRRSSSCRAFSPRVGRRNSRRARSIGAAIFGCIIGSHLRCASGVSFLRAMPLTSIAPSAAKG